MVMTEFNVGTRVHAKAYVHGVGNGTITGVHPMRTGGGIPYTGYEVEYDKPVRGPWPGHCAIRSAVHCAMALEVL